MSTVYIAMNQPLTTKYLKKGESSVDIDQLVEDVNELKQDVAGIEEVDETQNTNITTLQTDLGTVQTNITALQSNVSTHTTDITNLKASDTAQNADIDRLRHQIVLMCCFELDYKNGYYYDGKIITVDNDVLDVSNIPALQLDICACLPRAHGGGVPKLLFQKRDNVNQCLNNYYYLYPPSSVDSSVYSSYGFGVFNGLGENVFRNYKKITAANVADGRQLSLSGLMNDYGTDYYKQHYNDKFDYSLLDANVEVITNIKQWMTDKLTTSDFESMTNLKTWVESKTGGGTPTTTLKYPVDMYISTDGITDPQYSSHQVPFRISSASYKIGGSSCETSGYYISFHAELKGLNHITSITILAIKQGQTFPTFSWDSLCKFYKADFSTSDANKYGGIYFIMSDGSVCFTYAIGRAAFLLNEPKYVHFLTETIILDQLKNNVCKISNEEIEASTATYDDTRYPYYTFTGNEGSYREYDVIEPITE